MANKSGEIYWKLRKEYDKLGKKPMSKLSKKEINRYNNLTAKNGLIAKQHKKAFGKPIKNWKYTHLK